MVRYDAAIASEHDCAADQWVGCEGNAVESSRRVVQQQAICLPLCSWRCFEQYGVYCDAGTGIALCSESAFGYFDRANDNC